MRNRKSNMNNEHEVLVKVNGLGFTFYYDSKYNHNLMSPIFLSFFKEDYSSVKSLEENQKAVKEIFANSKEAFPVFPDHLHYFPFAGVYKEVGNNIIRCSDNKFRKCKAIRFTFQLDGKDNTMLFYIDNSLWTNKHAHVVIRKI